MIEIKNLTKIYKLNKKQMKESKTTNPVKTAVNDLSLTAKPGERYTACWDQTARGRQRRCGVSLPSSSRQKARSMYPAMKYRRNRKWCGRSSAS